MSRLGNEDEMEAARRKHAARDAEDHRRDRAESEEMWVQSERARKMRAEGGRPSGYWQFSEVLNSHGELIGWSVTLDGKKAGILVLRGDDVAIISASDSPSDPDATEIMAAFIKLYPGGGPEARALPRGQRMLTEGSPFGPSRDWSEDEGGGGMGAFSYSMCPECEASFRVAAKSDPLPPHREFRGTGLCPGSGKPGVR